MSAEDLLSPEPKNKLIVGGRYQILPQGGKKRKAHTRVTNFAKVLEDQYNLTYWTRRMDALGFADNPELVALIDVHRDDKDALNNICDQAKAKAGANDKRDAGSDLHAASETVDKGGEAPEQWAREIVVYLQALADAGIEILPEWIERTVVIDEFGGLAGTFDRIVRWKGELYIADLKSGSVGYNWLSFAIQFACYAHASSIYDHATQTHSPMPAVNQEKALVIHLPPGEVECSIYAVDIKTGWEAAKVVAEVKKLRNAGKKLGVLVGHAAVEPKPEADTTVIEATATAAAAVLEHKTVEQPAETPSQPEPEDKFADGSLRKWLEDKVLWLKDNGFITDLQARWPKGVAGLKASQDHTEAELDRILTVVNQLESKADKPFGEVDPRTPPPRQMKMIADKLVAEGATYVIEEGDEITFPEFEAIQVAFGKLDAKQQLTLGKIAGEAHAAGYPLNLRSKPHRRRADITQALIALADYDEDVIRAVVQRSTLDDIGDTPLGEVIGGMKLDAAAVFLGDARRLNAGLLVLTFGPNGPEIDETAADEDAA